MPETGHNDLKEVRQLSKSNSIEKTKELLGDLKQKIKNVQGGEEFKRILKTMAQFHSYSWCNTLLIWMQKPDSTRVAGYRKWQKLGRQVKKGERGIAIYAPMRIKVEIEDNEDEEDFILRFRIVYVFDLSQTEGDPLPTLECKPVADTHGALLDKLKNLCNKMKIEIVFEELKGIEGVSKIGQIVINSNRSATEKALIILHELAHEIIHSSIEKRIQLTNEQKELEAETTAWLVAQQLGLPETNSEKYLAIHQQSYDLMESLQVIHTTNQTILKFIASDLAGC